MNTNRPLGESVNFDALDSVSRLLVLAAWEVSHQAYCFQSNFPVGSAILAENASGETKVFHGCNVENEFFPATICAERNAATTAVAEGYTRFLSVAVVCRKIPGGSPCGLCRQFLTQFGRDAVLLSIVDKDKNVRRSTVGELLPAAQGLIVPRGNLPAGDLRLIERLGHLQEALLRPLFQDCAGGVLQGGQR